MLSEMLYKGNTNFLHYPLKKLCFYSLYTREFVTSTEQSFEIVWARMRMILLLTSLCFLSVTAVPRHSFEFKVDHYSWLDHTTDEIAVEPTIKIPFNGKEVEFQVKVSHN